MEQPLLFKSSHGWFSRPHLVLLVNFVQTTGYKLVYYIHVRVFQNVESFESVPSRLVQGGDFCNLNGENDYMRQFSSLTSKTYMQVVIILYVSKVWLYHPLFLSSSC